MSKKSEIERLKEELEALSIRQAEVLEKLENERREASRPLEEAVRKVADTVAEFQKLLVGYKEPFYGWTEGELEDLEITTSFSIFKIRNGKVSVDIVEVEDYEEWQPSNC